jgi:hypothetical protein
MNKNKKRARYKELLKTLAEIQSTIPDRFLSKSIKSLIDKMMKKDLDTKSTINYIIINLRKAQLGTSKVIWMKVLKEVQKYFDDVK